MQYETLSASQEDQEASMDFHENKSRIIGFVDKVKWSLTKSAPWVCGFFMIFFWDCTTPFNWEYPTKEDLFNYNQNSEWKRNLKWFILSIELEFVWFWLCMQFSSTLSWFCCLLDFPHWRSVRFKRQLFWVNSFDWGQVHVLVPCLLLYPRSGSGSNFFKRKI